MNLKRPTVDQVHLVNWTFGSIKSPHNFKAHVVYLPKLSDNFLL